MISVLIPVLNEEAILEESIRRLLSYIKERKSDFEIIVVSNGSTDRTAEIGRALERELPELRFFELPERGVGRAFVHAVRAASGEYLISLDVDLSSDLVFLEYAWDLLRYSEMVVGSKTMGVQRRAIWRVFASQTYIMLTNFVFDLTISDYSIGTKAYRRDAILPALEHLDVWTGYVFELCLFLRQQQQQRIIQIGIDCDDRRQSRFNLLHEGLFRYYHLFRCWRELRKPDSWYRPAAAGQGPASPTG